MTFSEHALPVESTRSNRMRQFSGMTLGRCSKHPHHHADSPDRPAAVNPYCRRNPAAAETTAGPAFQQESQFSSQLDWQSVRWFRRVRELLRLVGIRQLIPFFQTRRTAESDFLSVPFTNVFSSQVFRTDLISHDRTFRVDHSDHGRFGGSRHRRHGCRRCFSFSAPRKKIHPTTNKQKTNTISHLRNPCWNVSERSTNAVESYDSRIAIFFLVRPDNGTIAPDRERPSQRHAEATHQAGRWNSSPAIPRLHRTQPLHFPVPGVKMATNTTKSRPSLTALTSPRSHR